MPGHPALSPRFTSLSLRNFRGFKRAMEIPLAPLTFLVGPNSSGKSSLIDSLLLLAQSRFGPVGSFRPQWQGELVDLGSFEDAVFAHKKGLKIKIGFSAILRPRHFGEEDGNEAADVPVQFDFELRGGTGDPRGLLVAVLVRDLESGATMRIERVESGVDVSFDPSPIHHPIHLSDESREMEGYSWQAGLSRLIRKTLLEVLGRGFRRENPGVARLSAVIEDSMLMNFIGATDRVSSGRGGPDRWYSLGKIAQHLRNPYGPALYDTVDPSMVYPIARRPQRLGSRPSRATDDIARILKQLEIADAIRDEEISPYHSAIKVRDSVTGIVSNLMEVGYGASQVIPVIRACLSDSVSPLFVEQPEIHLHPRAQGAIAELLFAASLKRQTVVETHAIRLINRARIQVAKKVVPPDHVMVIYVDRTRAGSRFTAIPLDASGDFTAGWPKGFFDERFEDTMELLRLRGAEE